MFNLDLEAPTECTQAENNEEGEHMQGHVISAFLPSRAACWLVGCILPAYDLGMEEFYREDIKEAIVTEVCGTVSIWQERKRAGGETWETMGLHILRRLEVKVRPSAKLRSRILIPRLIMASS